MSLESATDIAGRVRSREGSAVETIEASLATIERLNPELNAIVTLNPRARSSVGARGLMQVMPFHAGSWGCGSSDLLDVETNICHGVKVLKQAIKDAPNMRKALLRYNGCVRGRNTPNCHTYDDKVLRHASRAAAQMRLVKSQKAE